MSKKKKQEPDKYNVACFLGQEGVELDTFKNVWNTIYGEQPDAGSLENYTNAYDMKGDKCHESYEYDNVH